MIEIFKDRVKKDIFKLSYDPYRNPWFLVKKKEKGKYRLINTVIKINRVIIRDANLPSFINEFFKEFAEYIILFLIDFFSSYNRIEFNKKNKNLIAFYISIELLKMIIFF